MKYTTKHVIWRLHKKTDCWIKSFFNAIYPYPFQHKFKKPTHPKADWFTKAGNFERHRSVPQELPLHNGTLNLKWKKFLGERIEVEMEPIVAGDFLYIGLMNGKMICT